MGDAWRRHQFPGERHGVVRRPRPPVQHAKCLEDPEELVGVVRLTAEDGLASEELGHDAAERPVVHRGVIVVLPQENQWIQDVQASTLVEVAT